MYTTYIIYPYNRRFVHIGKDQMSIEQNIKISNIAENSILFYGSCRAFDSSFAILKARYPIKYLIYSRFLNNHIFIICQCRRNKWNFIQFKKGDLLHNFLNQILTRSLQISFFFFLVIHSYVLFRMVKVFLQARMCCDFC